MRSFSCMRGGLRDDFMRGKNFRNVKSMVADPIVHIGKLYYEGGACEMCKLFVGLCACM